MLINKETLKGQLQQAEMLFDKKAVDQNMNCFLFFGDNLITYNNDAIYIGKNPVPELQGSIRGVEFLTLLNKIVVPAVDVSPSDGQILVKAGRIKAGIRYAAIDDCPFFDAANSEFSGAKHNKITGQFIEAIMRASKVAAKKAAKPIYTAIIIHNNAVYSTDNFRIFNMELSEMKNLPSMCLPGFSAKWIAEMKPKKLCFSDKYAFFVNENDDVLGVRLIQAGADGIENICGVFNKYLRAKGSPFSFPPELLHCLEKTDIFTKPLDSTNENCVNITLKNGRITVKGEGPYGWLEESVKAVYSGELLEFMVNPDFLKDTLPFVSDATLTDKGVMFFSETFQYVILRILKPVEND